VSVLGAPVSLSYLSAREAALIGWLGQTFAPLYIPNSRQAALGLFVLAPYVYFAWRSPAKPVARPYLIALGTLFADAVRPAAHAAPALFPALHPDRRLGRRRYPRPVPETVIRAVAMAALLALSVVPSLFLIGGLAEPPPVAAIQWIKSTRPDAIILSESLSRHLTFYWSEAAARPRPEKRTAPRSPRTSPRGIWCCRRGPTSAALEAARWPHSGATAGSRTTTTTLCVWGPAH
jgi:hypothetical protein